MCMNNCVCAYGSQQLTMVSQLCSRLFFEVGFSIEPRDYRYYRCSQNASEILKSLDPISGLTGIHSSM